MLSFIRRLIGLGPDRGPTAASIVVSLPEDRARYGKLIVLDDKMRVVGGPWWVSGVADAAMAARAGNPARLATRRFGNTPLGTYVLAGRGRPADQERARALIGPHPTLVFHAASGEAAVAEAAGRGDLIIHGGPPGPTNGSLRLSDEAMETLLALMPAFSTEFRLEITVLPPEKAGGEVAGARTSAPASASASASAAAPARNPERSSAVPSNRPVTVRPTAGSSRSASPAGTIRTSGTSGSHYDRIRREDEERRRRDETENQNAALFWYYGDPWHWTDPHHAWPCVWSHADEMRWSSPDEYSLDRNGLLQSEFLPDLGEGVLPDDPAPYGADQYGSDADAEAAAAMSALGITVLPDGDPAPIPPAVRDAAPTEGTVPADSHPAASDPEESQQTDSQQTASYPVDAGATAPAAPTSDSWTPSGGAYDR